MDLWAMNKDRVAERDGLMARDCYDDCIAALDDQLGRLLEELRGQGLLENTLVVITSDHGEGFGDHGVWGHGTGVYIEQISVPLVILSPGGPAGRIMDQPISLRDLPVTVVDLLGLSVGVPLPGNSLAAAWWTRPGETLPVSTPAFTEVANRTAFQSQPQRGRRRRGFQMSILTSGGHYVRDGMGAEQLYALFRDPYETVNLIGSAEGKQVVGMYRRMLLKFLTDNPGSIEVETAYLTPYRQLLKALVDEDPAPRASISALPEPSNKWRK
jgi:arylsulfatase A-like enzyme